MILYTWTEDGKWAENRFEEVALVGPQGKVNIDLEMKPEPTSPARLDIRRAVATVEGNDRGIPQATIRALADRNVILIDQGWCREAGGRPLAGLARAGARAAAVRRCRPFCSRSPATRAGRE